MLNHWVHSQAQALLIFPNTYRLFDSTIGFLGHRTPETFWTQCCSTRNYVKRLPFWQWGKWSGEIPSQSVVPILVNLFVLAVGFRQAWKKAGWNALLPAGMAFGYYFANGLARTSGGRYLQPVDWVWIVYYSIGMASLAAGLFRLFGVKPASVLLNEPTRGVVTISIVRFPQQLKSSLQSQGVQIFTIGLGFLLLGLAIPAAEFVFPPRYTEETRQAMFAAFAQANNEQGLAPHLDTFFANGGMVLQGRGMYLRYYGAEQGEPGSLYPAVYPRPFPRLSLFLIGPTPIGVYLPIEGRPDIRAQNAVDVLVLGCMQMIEKGPYFDALALYYPATDELFLRAPFPETLTCPLPEP
jgi:hypothetical protein